MVTHYARVHTTTLNIHGNLHTNMQADASSIFNHPRPFFPITECKVYKKSFFKVDTKDLMVTPEFLILPKDSVLWVGGLEGKHLSRQNVRNLYLIYDQYILKGEISLPTTLRLSDFLSRTTHEKPFQYLFNVEVRIPEAGKPLLQLPVLERIELALVNIAKASGLFDIAEDNSSFDLSGF
jgi:hypothetical protein